MSVIMEAKDLKIHYATEKGAVQAVDGVSFQIFKGETLGLVGESGCGKTTLGYGLLNMVAKPGTYAGGDLIFQGDSIIGYTEVESRKNFRWKKVAMVFQGAMNSLTPVFTIRKQMYETLKLHQPMEKEEAELLMKKYINLVGLADHVLDRYPHELSGGMKQRVIIAMALFLEPQLVILDEPTTALDVIVQAQILNLLKDLKEKLDLSFVFITHDLATEAEIADRIMVMYAGKVAEIGTSEQIFGDKAPLHPYTQKLLASTPRLYEKVDKLAFIPGTPPNLLDPPAGCLFAARCDKATDKCRTEVPEVKEYEPGHFAACWEVEA